jgi:Ca2+-binding RTX toxin-like protein
MTASATLFGRAGEAPRGGRPRLGLELLDDRTMPSCTLGLTSDGQLQIYGTGAADAVAVSRGEGHLFVKCQSAGEAVEVWAFNDGVVNRILFVGEAGDDSFENETDLPSHARGNAGNDVLIGGSVGDQLAGGVGDDTIKGRGGDDTINGHAGNDVIDGGDNNDTIYGMEGDDWISGGSGDDRVEAGVGDDLVYGDAGDDALLGQSGKDELHGGDNDDTLNGGHDGVPDLLYGDDDGDDGRDTFADHLHLVSGVWVSEDVFAGFEVGLDDTTRHEWFDTH